SETRTRDAGAPSDSVASMATAAIGDRPPLVAWFATPSAATLRKSTRSVSGSGRDVKYGTGAVASMTGDAVFPLVRDEMTISRGASVASLSPLPVPFSLREVAPDPATSATPQTAAQTIAAGRNGTLRLVTVIPWRPRAT